MLKRKKIILSLMVLLLLVSFGGLAYLKFQSRLGVKKQIDDQFAINSKEEGLRELKKMICSEEQTKLSDPVIFESKIKQFPDNILREILTQEQVLDLANYYFCGGLLAGDSEKACRNKFVLSAFQEQCQNGFSFNQMMLESLLGNGSNAKDLCQRNLGHAELCDYVVSFEEAGKSDLCNKVAENEKPSCLAFFRGDDSLCKGSQQEDDCFVSAKFLNVFKNKKVEDCDSLKAVNIFGHYDVLCRLALDKTQASCLTQYQKFVQAFCNQ